MLDTEEEELLETIEALSPLTALDPDQVDKLTIRQQAFLIEFIHTGSIVTAKRKSRVKQKDWAEWATDDQFQHIFGIVKSPLQFALNLRQAIQWRAGLKLFDLLQHERVSVVQWAVERAFSMGPISGPDSPEKSSLSALSQADAKKLAAQVVEALEESNQAAVQSTPFLPAPTKHTIIDAIPEASHTGPQSE